MQAACHLGPQPCNGCSAHRPGPTCRRSPLPLPGATMGAAAAASGARARGLMPGVAKLKPCMWRRRPRGRSGSRACRGVAAGPQLGRRPGALPAGRTGRATSRAAWPAPRQHASLASQPLTWPSWHRGHTTGQARPSPTRGRPSAAGAEGAPAQTNSLPPTAIRPGKLARLRKAAWQLRHHVT